MSRIRTNLITNRMANGAPTVSNGLVISGVTTSTNVSVASSVTATTYYGSGANLTNITSTTINNNADNRVITGSNTSNTLEGESNVVINGGKLGIGVASPAQLIEVHGASNPAVLVQDTTNNCISYMYSQDSVATFGSASNHPVVFNVNNGEKLRIGTNGSLSINYAGNGDNTLHIGCTSNAGGIIIKAPGNHYANIVTDSNRSGANNGILNLAGRWNGNDVAYISFTTGTDTSNKDDGYIRMYTRESGQSLTERVQIKEAGGFVSNKGGGSIAFSDGYSAIEARAPEGTTQLTVTNTTYESGTFDNEAGIWFKGNYSGNNERAKSAIIHKNTGDYGVGDLYFCLDGTGDNSNATVSDVKMKIDSSGQVTKPSQVGFHATGTSTHNHTSNFVPQFNTEYFDIGGGYNNSNYRFTAPVTGRYFLYFQYLTYPNSDPDYKTFLFRKNGSSSGLYDQGFYRGREGQQGNQTSQQMSTYIQLAENDYIEPYVECNGGTFYNYMGSGHSHFWGFLVH